MICTFTLVLVRGIFPGNKMTTNSKTYRNYETRDKCIINMHDVGTFFTL